VAATCGAASDDIVICRFMLKPNPDGVCDYAVEQWRKRGLL